MRRILVLIIILVGVLFAIGVGQKYLPELLHLDTGQLTTNQNGEKVKVITEESLTIDTVKKAGPSVVTVVGTAKESTARQFSPFNNPFFSVPGYENPDGNDSEELPQSIGSGFLIDAEGLVVTNKHVVSDTSEKYQIITNTEKKYDVLKIYRDPSNDIALLQIDLKQNPGTTLKPLTLGDSNNLQPGQYVVAIGTALGEFRNSVTTGVISGVGRGITAGSLYEGSVERLDNVIQTDAAINPGNSGGPLFNSSGQVIGVNTAVSESGQNIGFAIPINVIKDSLTNFNQTGKFDRPYLGVAYKLITKNLAIMNELPQGAYVQEVIDGSAAEEAGLEAGDIITKIDGNQIDERNQISAVIAKKKIGDVLTLTYVRDTETKEAKATLHAAPQE